MAPTADKVGAPVSSISSIGAADVAISPPWPGYYYYYNYQNYDYDMFEATSYKTSVDD